MRHFHFACIFLFLLRDVIPAEDCSDAELSTIVSQAGVVDFYTTKACIGAIQRSPKNAALYFDLLTQLYGHGRSEEVMQLLDEAVVLIPTNANYLFLRGTVLANAGRLEEAIESYQYAVIHHPTHVDAIHNYAAIMMDHPLPTARHRELIMRSLDMALRLLPSSPKLKLSAGVILSELEIDVRASRLLRLGTFFEQGSALVHGALGRSLERLGHIRQAESAHLKALDLSPESAQLKAALGYHYMAQERYAMACSWFEKGLDSQPADPLILLGMGECLRGQKRLSDALEYYQVWLAFQ